MGLERLEEDRALKFVERALPSDLVPDRDLGFDLHGNLFAQRVDYALGLFNGTPDNTATADSDNNDGKDFTGRIFVIPSPTPRWSTSASSASASPAPMVTSARRPSTAPTRRSARTCSSPTPRV